MTSKPLRISIDKIIRAQEGREIQERMEAGGSGSIEESYRLLQILDPTGEWIIEQHRLNFQREKDYG